MRLEQRMEQAEEQLERNEENKRRVVRAQQQLQSASNRANSCLAQVQRSQNQLQQAIAARTAAIAQASREEDGGYVSPSYDAAVESAQAELNEARQELQLARREVVEAQERVIVANGDLHESTQALSGVVAELQQVSERYDIEMEKTRELMSLPDSHIASPLLQRLGIGKQNLDNLRRRIAVSLGIAFVATSGIEGVGSGDVGGHGVLAKLRNRGRGDTLRHSSGSGGNGPNVYFNGPMSGFRRINGSHSIESDLAKVNPNYSHTNPDSVWNINCQRCVMAYEARRRGYDVEALPVPGTGDKLSTMSPTDGLPTVFKNPNPIDCSANSGTGAKLNVDEQMEQWGDNCRAIVCVCWKGGLQGHVFIAERANGVTRYIDPQNNCTDASDYFMDAMGRGVYCMRTDDQEFSEKIKQCCKNAGGS